MRFLSVSDENIWSMGETGPCGLCTELFFDTSAFSADLRNESDTLLEIWNLVFMDRLRTEKGEIKPLSRPCIDTGMGLERIASVLQGQASNFGTDVLHGVIHSICALLEARTGRSLAYQDSFGGQSRTDVILRILADHLRSVIFLIAEGTVPSPFRQGLALAFA